VQYRRPERLARKHELDDFDCGEPALDEWLKRHARAADASESARVFVVTQDGAKVVAYYTLAAAQVEPRSATARAAKGQPSRPIPAVLLARLAVDRRHQSRGLGRSLLQDVMLRCVAAADEIGARVLLVHAKNERAKGWYERYGFEESPTDPLHVMLLMKDVRRFVNSS
jgi:ribosomal protein S18 acetylase RimI-like enzyme